jgi:spoIIIJ-associated protein
LTERKYSVTSVGIRIDGFLQTTLENAGLELDYDILDAAPAEDDFETPDVMVKFSGPDVDALLNNRAELLLALEHVTMEMLKMPSEDHSRISFDANDYRALRIEELRVSATTAAERVIRTGQPFRFNPMNSRERRVIHLALRNETAIRSESAGTGPGRMVIVYPAGMASLPDPPPYVPPPAHRSGGPGGDRGGRGGPRRDGDRGGRPPRRDGRGGDRRGPRR